VCCHGRGEPESLGLLGEEQNSVRHGPGESESWGYLGKNKNSFRHGPGGSEFPGATWGRTKVASLMALGESESPGILEE
jgi:hypothetical protein